MRIIRLLSVILFSCVALKGMEENKGRKGRKNKNLLTQFEETAIQPKQSEETELSSQFETLLQDPNVTQHNSFEQSIMTISPNDVPQTQYEKHASNFFLYAEQFSTSADLNFYQKMQNCYQAMKKCKVYSKREIKEKLSGMADDFSDDEINPKALTYARFRAICTKRYNADEACKNHEAERSALEKENQLHAASMNRLIAEKRALETEIDRLQQNIQSNTQTCNKLSQKKEYQMLAMAVYGAQREQLKKTITNDIHSLEKIIQEKTSTIEELNKKSSQVDIDKNSRERILEQIIQEQSILAESSQKQNELVEELNKINAKLQKEKRGGGWLSGWWQ